MKPLVSLMIICSFAVALGIGAAVGCGPKKAYCPQNQSGACFEEIDAGPPDIPDVGPGEAIIIQLG